MTIDRARAAFSLLFFSAAPLFAICTHVRGTVLSSGKPVGGAKVYLLAASTAGYGAKSLSVHAWNFHHDAIGYFSRTKADGSFDARLQHCRAHEQMYVLAVGGAVGAGSINPARAELSVLGPCPGKTIEAVVVNDVTTVAGVYALGGLMSDAAHVASGRSDVAVAGIVNAFATVKNLVDAQGVARAEPVGGNGYSPQTTVNLLANIVSLCGASDGSGSGCSQLLQATGAKPGGTTVDALIKMNRLPGANVAGIEALNPSPHTYLPTALDVGDFTLRIVYRSANMMSPAMLAIDSKGNVWIPNDVVGGGSLTELSPLGEVLSGEKGFTGGGLLAPIAVAIDQKDQVWVANDSAPGRLSLFSAKGMPLSPANGFIHPVSGALDLAGAVAVSATNDGPISVLTTDGKVTQFSAAGTPSKCVVNISPLGGTDDFGLAYTPDGTLWATDYLGHPTPSRGFLDRIDPAKCTFSQIGGNKLLGPQFLASDKDGNVWVGNNDGAVLSVFDKNGNALTQITNRTESQGGLASPNGIEVDGDGVIWVANFSGDSVSNFKKDGTALSPGTTAYVGGLAEYGFTLPPALAIDASGNVWVSEYDSGNATNPATVGELVGAASPVETPLNPSHLGQRPR